MKYKMHNVTHVKVKAIFHIYAVLYYASFFTLFFLFSGVVQSKKPRVTSVTSVLLLNSSRLFLYLAVCIPGGRYHPHQSS